MNKVILTGVLKDIAYSHTIQGVEYEKAALIVKRPSGKEDLINIKYKKFSNTYNENDIVSLVGNVRTYTQHIDGKNKVEVYVFSYFDRPEDETILNSVELSGRICKKNELRKTQLGKDVLDFIIANNLVTENQTLNCYIPCVAWGKLAKEISKLDVGTTINVTGQLQSREYRKKLDGDNFEIRIAHELNLSDYNIEE